LNCGGIQIGRMHPSCWNEDAVETTGPHATTRRATPIVACGKAVGILRASRGNNLSACKHEVYVREGDFTASCVQPFENTRVRGNFAWPSPIQFIVATTNSGSTSLFSVT
jgi:hypothetical protein